MSELKPCPFCGSENVIPVEADYLNEGGKVTILWDVECQDCQSLVRKSMWNRRPAEDALKAEIKRLKAALSDISKIGFEGKIGDKVARATMRRIADYTLTGKDINVPANAPDTNVGTMEEKK